MKVGEKALSIRSDMRKALVVGTAAHRANPPWPTSTAGHRGQLRDIKGVRSVCTEKRQKTCMQGSHIKNVLGIFLD